MAFKVIITPPAQHRLDMYIGYTVNTLKKRREGKLHSLLLHLIYIFLKEDLISSKVLYNDIYSDSKAEISGAHCISVGPPM